MIQRLFWRGKQRESDLEDEMAFDVAADAAERVLAGAPPEEAQLASRRDFGNLTMVKEDVREAWGWASLARLGQDAAYGWRTFRKAPLFFAMTALSLGLGIGANTAIYSVMDAILFRVLPVQDPHELVILNWRAIRSTSGFTEPAGIDNIDGSVYTGPAGDRISPDFPWTFYASLRDGNEVFSKVLAYKDAGRLTLSVQGRAELGQVEFVSGNFFNALGIHPAAGRLIDDSDNPANAPPVAILSNHYWHARFAGNAVVGSMIHVGNIPLTICGIAPPEFFGIRPGSAPDLYIPIGTRPLIAADSTATAAEKVSMFTDAHYYWVDMIGRLRPGISMARAERDIATRFRQFALGAGANNHRGDLPALWLREGGSGLDSLRQQYSKPLFVLMSMVALILMIACANVANLLLARAASRRREMAVRLSLGASRPRIFRQMVTESVLLALPGGALGLGIAAAGIRFLLWLLSGGSRDFQIRAQLDLRILAFTVAVTFATGIIFGLAPALEAMRVEISPTLKGTALSSKRGRRVRLSHILVTAQVALSLLLVLGAALFTRTLANLHAIDVGYNAGNLLTFNLNASKAGYPKTTLTGFYARLEERVSVFPGVRNVTVTASPISAGGSYSTLILFPGNRKGSAGWDSVGPSFFETLQVPIVLGRALDARDKEGTLPAAVVNEAFARKYFPNENPVGQHVGMILDGGKQVTIIGVAKNFQRSLKGQIAPFIYVSYHQFPAPPWRGMFFEVRTAGKPSALAASIRNALYQAAPDVPIADMMTQSQRIENSLTQERTFAELCTAFAILALTIACVGLYGSMAYAVSRQTNDIGIRMALGAHRRLVIWMVMREVLALTSAGLAIGFICARSVMPAIRSFLFGVGTADPCAILWATAALIVSSLLAGYVPALRASRIDPLSALRHE